MRRECYIPPHTDSSSGVVLDRSIFFHQVGISNSKLALLMRNAIIVAVMGISPSPILSNRTHMGVNSQKYGKSPPVVIGAHKGPSKYLQIAGRF